MKCGIANCAVSDNNFLWSCSGACKRHFHAACIGVQRNSEELIRAFMLPLCIECQPQATAQLDWQKLALQQQKMNQSITHLMECSHKIITHSTSLSATLETLDGIETKLNELTHGQQRIAEINKCNTTKILERTQTFTDTVVLDQNKAAETATEVAAAAVECIKTTATEALQHIPTAIDSLKIDIADTYELLKSEVKLRMEELTCAINSPASHASHKKSIIPVIHSPLSEELAAANESKNSTKQPITPELQNTTATPPLIPQSTSGWRFIGTKKLWKADWSEYDDKRRRRAAQQRLQEKSIKRRRHARRNAHRTPRTENNKATSNNTPPVTIPLPLDRHLFLNKGQQQSITTSDGQLLAIAKAQFAGPPSSIDHPIAGLSAPKFIRFKKGETINPYRADRQMQLKDQHTSQQQQHQQQKQKQQHQQPQHTQDQRSSLCNKESGFVLDPMRPPIVRLTEQSAEGDGRFLKARLRDAKIMRVVRMFLAYMKDQDETVCVDGMTPTSIRMLLASEGLPSNPDHLLQIFKDVHQEYGLNPAAAMADLETYRRFLSSERIHRLQQLRNSSYNFGAPFQR